MGEANTPGSGNQTGAAAPVLHVAPSPHVKDPSQSTRRMMLDVLIGLSPLAIASVLVFRWFAVWQMAVCVVSAVVTEAVLVKLRGRRSTVGDLSAVVTGLILALSLPGTTPVYVAVIAAAAGIAIGKFIFGGLGHNIFNPAMVGRAFVMVSFAWALGAGAYVASEKSSMNWLADLPGGQSAAITQATPMTEYKAEEGATPVVPSVSRLFWGNTNGSLGETSAIACLIGGAYLLIRRAASWRLPAGALVGLAGAGLLRSFGASSALAGLVLTGQFAQAAEQLSTHWTLVHEILGGAFLFGALFIITDPVSTPITRGGRWAFGIGYGVLVVLLRSMSVYPEGVMYAVLLMNCVAPLLNRWTIPRPVGGPVPAGK